MNAFEGNLLNKPKPNQINKPRNTSVGNPSTLHAQPQYTQPKSGWYAGDQPTASETIAQIYKVGKDNPDVLSQLNDMFNAEIMNPESNLYQPYLMPTTDKVNDTNIRNTNNAMNEWNQLQAELAYWANRADRNYSDDEIINRIDMTKYPTLAKMDAYKTTGVTMELLAPVGYSKDAMYGVLWSARNGGQTSGNYIVDAAQGIMGNGNKYQRNEDLYGRRDATSDNYAPYTVGATALDDLSYKYGMKGDFTEEWLNGAGRALLNGDEQARADYNRIYNTVMNTKKLNEEAALFNEYVQKAIESGVDPAKFFTDEFESDMKEDYPELYKALEGQRSGKLYETSGAVGFDYNKAQRDMKANWDRINGNVTPDQMDAAMSAEFGLPDSKDEAQAAIDQQASDKAANAGWMAWNVATDDERTTIGSNPAQFNSSKATGGKMLAVAGADTDAPHRTAMNAANAYAGEYYLNARKIHDGLVAEFYGNDAMRSLLETYFPEHAANGTVPSLSEFVALEESNEEFSTAVFQAGKFLGDVGEKLKQLDNEKKILKGVDERYKLAEELGQGGSARDFLNFVYRFDGYEAQPMLSVAVWSPQQYKQNSELIAMFEDYISKAEELKVPAEYVDGLRAAVGELQTNNYLMEASKLKYVGDFGEKVKEFDESQKAYVAPLVQGPWNAVSHADLVRFAIVDVPSAMSANVNETDSSIVLVSNMTDTEKNIYKYIYSVDGEEAATEYFDALTLTLSYRGYERVSGVGNENFANAGEAIGRNVGSVLINALSSMNVFYKAYSELTGKEVNKYDPMNWLSLYSQKTRESSKRQINEQLGEGSFAASLATFGYDAGMASLDSMTSALLGGGSTGGLVLMGGAAMDSALMDAEMRGAEGVQKWVYAGAVAAAEVLTEKLPMDALADALKSGSVKGVKEFFAGALKQLGKGFITDAPGEMLSEFFGEMADQIIMDEMANYAARFEQLVNEEGLSPAEAQLVADREVLSNMLYAFALGGVSAGGSNVAAYTVGSVFGGNENEDGGSETKPTEEQPANEQKPKNKWVAAAEEMAEAETAEESATEQAEEATVEVPEAVQNDPVKSAEAVLAKAESLGTGTTESAGLIASVMEGVAGMDSMEADAAARTIAAKWKDPLFTTRRMIRNSPDAARTLHAMELAALVPDSQTAEAINTMVESGEVTPEAVGIVNTVYEQEMADNGLRERLDAKIASMATAETTVGLLAQSDLDSIKQLDADAAAAKAQMEKAQAEYDSLSERMNADMAALDSARDAFYANLADESVKNKYLQVFERYSQDKDRMLVANDNLAAAQKNHADAKAKAETGRTELLNSARVEAKAQVAQRMEQRRAELEALAQQEAQAAETKRQSDNIAVLESENFIEDAYQDASETDHDGLQQAYMDVVNEDSAAAENEPTQPEKPNTLDPAERKAIEFVTQLSRRFRVKFNFVDSNSNFEGKYQKGVITINRRTTQGEAIRKVALHELVHHVEKTGEYRALAEAVRDYFFEGDTEAYDKEVEGIRQLYESKKNELKITENIDTAYAERELVAEYAARLFEADSKFIDRLVAEKPSLAVRVYEALRGIVHKLRGVKDAELDTIRRAEKAFEKALESSADPRARNLQQAADTSEHPNAEQFSISQFARAAGLQMRTNSDGQPYSIVDSNGNEVKTVTPEMIKASPMGRLIATAESNGSINSETAQKQYDMFAELMSMVAEYKDQAMIWEIAGSELFSAIKSNSDSQYSTTVDFGTICSKTREVVSVMSETMLKKGRGLTRGEVLDAYRSTHNAGMAVPCPVCYVFSRWMGVPSLLETMRKGQERFANATDADVNAYLDTVREKYGIEGKDLSESVGKAKTKLQGKLKKINETLMKGAFKPSENEADLIAQANELQAQLDEIELFNWVMQVLCKTDSKRKPVLDRNGRVTIDPNYKPVPNEVLLDLRKTGEFASEYGKAWTFRTTRGAGMGKAILPYSGAELGDSVSGVKRWSASQNPFFTGNDKLASRKLRFAMARAKIQNLIGGQRFQSTSDYRPEWGLDYLSTFLEMQAIGAKGQLYTKVIEAVDMFATAGIEVNLSIMPKNNGYHLDSNGNPVLGVEDFSDVTGINFEGALEKTQKYDNVQMILVGINDTQIELAMADDRISFIIPWHSSGNSKDTLATLMNAVGENLTNSEDYTDIQTDKPSENQTHEQKAMWDLRMNILTGKLKKGLTVEQQQLLNKNPYLKSLYNKFYVDQTATDTYGVKLNKAQAGQIFPHEYWDTSLNREQADENGKRFVEYCKSMGIEPRFAKFSDKPGYWKLLIDRSMYNNDGTYHEPKVIDVTKVDIGDVAPEVSQARVGTRDQISEAVQRTIEAIDARLPAEPFDMTADIDISAENGEGQYSLPSNDVLKRQVRAWRTGQNTADQTQNLPSSEVVSNQENYGIGERQFVAKTLPGNPNIPQWAVEGMQNNPEARYYEKDTNRAQLIRAWQRIQENGVEAERDRLVNLESPTADDTAEANLLMAMSLREDTSDPATFFQLSLMYAKSGTESGKDLQVRSLFPKMTPDGARIWVAGKSEQALEGYLDGHTKYRDEINQRADKVSDTIRNMQSGDQLLRLNAGGDFTIDSTNNKWGVPLNEQQLALIEQYGLQNEARPGIFYNRATIKQRMLEAIIATPNPLEVTNLGLTLVHRLEMMKDGKAVVTNADLNYIGQRLGEFMGLGQDAGGRAADVALARAYEAFGNITPASGWEKFRTQRYVNMLLTIPTFTRNFMGNAFQNALNAASHGIAVELDKKAAKKTGRRTLEHLSVEERVNGWKAFAEETKNTFKDFFIDKVDAAPNKEKYSTNRKGRTFQNNVQEGMRNLESFMMSVGDRNVWKKAFVNSMAEQQKLADRGLLFNDNGTTRTHEQMVEKAEEAANFATFTEDGFVQKVIGYANQLNPRLGDVLSIYLPFTGVPTNIMKRSMQYSPMGLLWAVGKRGYQHVTKQNFDQQKFVEGVARGLTGTAMMTVGALLGAAGFIRMGTEDDESDKVYDANTAMGNQYTPYVYDPTTDTYVSLSTFAPSVSPLVWGASVAEALKGNEPLLNIFINALSSSTDSILDASYLSSISDIFGGYGSITENIVDVGLENIASQMIPALLTQTANALDPYVRETKDKDKLVELLKKTVNKIPGLRNVVLPEKITVAGENVLTKPGASNYVDPFTRTNPSRNEALIEAMRLYEVLGTTDVLPSDALRSRTNSFSRKIDNVQWTVTLNDEQKEEYKKYYGDLWTSRVSELMSDFHYQQLDDKQKGAKVKKILQDCLTDAKIEFLKRYGHEVEE